MTEEAAAEVNVEINLGPPVIMMDEPAEVVFMPAYGIYFVPGLAYDIFFYNGFWWSSRGRHWYRSRYYSRGWTISMDRNVPGPLLRVPKDYRKRFSQSKHIRYHNWKGRPSGPTNMNRNKVKDKGQSGNSGRLQPNENNMERSGEKERIGEPNSGRGGSGQNMERGGDRGEGHSRDNEGEGGHR
jgi:hypothetical protein